VVGTQAWIWILVEFDRETTILSPKESGNQKKKIEEKGPIIARVGLISLVYTLSLSSSLLPRLFAAVNSPPHSTVLVRRRLSRNMLYIIGLGLGDEKDITLKGLEAIQKCEKVYMEAYTSLLSFGLSSHGLSNLEKLYGKPIILADREMVEEKADDFLSQAQLSHVAFLVVGDPFGYACLLLLL
jgi:hypothetical protein